MVSNENIFQSFERHISLPHSISLFYGLIKSPIAANFTFFSKFYNFPFLKSSTKVNRRRDGHATISWWSVGRSAVWPNLANFASLSKFYKPLAIVCEFIVCGRRRKTSELLELLFYFLYSTWKYCVVPTLAIFNYIRKIFILLNELILYLGRGGVQVVSVLTFYSDDSSSNTFEVCSFILKLFEKIENKQKEAKNGLFKNQMLYI